MAKSNATVARASSLAVKPPAAKKKPPIGTDQALVLPAARRKRLKLSYWDLWFTIIAARDHGGDLLRLARGLARSKDSFFWDCDSTERKQSHLLDLRHRLLTAGVTIEQVVAAAGNLLRFEKSRAEKFVLKDSLREWQWSEAMRSTPHERRQQAAMRGSWPLFPLSPEPFAEEIWSKFETRRFYSENASFGVARKLDRFVNRAEKLLSKKRFAEAQALLRAWITVVVELNEIADDSFGCIGDSFEDGFTAYLKIPLAETGIEEPVFFADLLDFLIWEDYGLTDDAIQGYFRRLKPDEADFCMAHLRRQREELAAELMDYQSEEALTLLAQVVTEQDRFDQFESLAAEMGSRAWQRIIRLADRAMKKRKRELACKVLEAALTRGDHLEFLRQKYDQLKQGRWNPDPRK